VLDERPFSFEANLLKLNNMNINKLIDHTNLKADANLEAIKKTCQEAKEYGFRSVCINPRWVGVAKNELRGTDIKVVTVIDWPCGASSTEVRAFQAKVAKKDGADEIDPVIDVGALKAGDDKAVLRDLQELAKILPTKVIIESGFLNDEQIKKAARIVKAAGCYCVKTSTGLDPKTDIDTKINHVKLIRSEVGETFPIKASGGINTKDDVQRLVEAGATIIGTSSSLKIIGVSQKTESY